MSSIIFKAPNLSHVKEPMSCSSWQGLLLSGSFPLSYCLSWFSPYSLGKKDNHMFLITFQAPNLSYVKEAMFCSWQGLLLSEFFPLNRDRAQINAHA